MMTTDAPPNVQNHNSASSTLSRQSGFMLHP